jgi:hypothetical protein
MLVAVKPEGAHTEYAGWFYFPESRAWGLVSRFRAPKDGNYLSGLYSFSENSCPRPSERLIGYPLSGIEA